MARIEQSDTFAAVPMVDLGQGDRINLGVVGIMSRLPDVAAAVGGVTAALRETGALAPRLMELVRLRIGLPQPVPQLYVDPLPERDRRRTHRRRGVFIGATS